MDTMTTEESLRVKALVEAAQNILDLMDSAEMQSVRIRGKAQDVAKLRAALAGVESVANCNQGEEG